MNGQAWARTGRFPQAPKQGGLRARGPSQSLVVVLPAPCVHHMSNRGRLGGRPGSNSTRRPHARMHETNGNETKRNQQKNETKRNEFPGGLTPQPPIYTPIHVYVHTNTTYIRTHTYIYTHTYIWDTSVTPAIEPTFIWSIGSIGLQYFKSRERKNM